MKPDWRRSPCEHGPDTSPRALLEAVMNPDEAKTLKLAKVLRRALDMQFSSLRTWEDLPEYARQSWLDAAREVMRDMKNPAWRDA